MKPSLRIVFLVFICLFGISACQQLPVNFQPSTTPQISVSPSITPSITSNPTAFKCQDTGGKVEQRTFQSALLGKEVQLRVYLPACYQSDFEYQYPVLYLLHGQTFTDDQWLRLGAGDIADRLIRDGDRNPFLMVLPFDEDNLKPTSDSKFGQVIVDELIPWIDQNYRTCSEKSCRSIAGLSRGAGWAIHLGLTHPDIFESVAAHSLPSFNGDDQQIPIWLEGISIESLPRIWMDSGRSDLFLPQARKFEETLTKYQIPHEFFIYAGYHDEKYWQAHMNDYILWSTLNWK